MKQTPRPPKGVAPSAATLDWFASGILLLDRNNKVASSNTTARAMLHAQSTDLTGWTCCDVLCDHLDIGGRRCLCQEARARSDALPEIRIDIPGEGTAEALWVVAKGIETTERVLIELRPGALGDRRRRTDPFWIEGERIRISALGRTRITTSESSLTGEWISHRPGQVLKYLLSRRSDLVQADEIAEALWPDPDAKALTSVRYAIHNLRGYLEPNRRPHTPSAFVMAQGGGYHLERDRIWVDVDEFDKSLAAGFRALEAGNEEDALEHLENGVRIYGGDFIADERYADWAIAERERLRHAASGALNRIIDLRSSKGNTVGALGSARRLAELEPYDNASQRQCLELCISDGRRTEALRRFEAFRSRLWRDFEDRPDFSLAEVTSNLGASAKGLSRP